ncbi:hypothetical protein CK203_011639 [Vitis vinifera]|uniref:Uncharacterized protein n=1 Tax=Vitis vinifera TaxID=29760 RepID=A0A438JUA7_VITVI|nr:hypothetical protein CK203_011639 [Vitis vinifera]
MEWRLLRPCVLGIHAADKWTCFQPRLSSGSVVPVKDVRTGCPDTPSDGGGRAIITLQAAVRDRGRQLVIAPILSPYRRRNVGCDRLSGMTQQGLLVTVNDPDNRCAPRVNPDKDAGHVSSWGVRSGSIRIKGSCCPSAPFAGYRSWFGVKPRVRMGMLVMLGSVSSPFLKMPAKKDVASSSVAGQSGKDASGVVYAEKSVDKLNVRQFCERFCIPNDVSVQLVDGEAVSTEKFADNAIYFTNEQFNAGLRFPLPSLFKEFLHFTQIPPAYIHPNIVRVLMGCSILSMLFNLDLSLLEVLFIYSIKKGKTDLFSLAAYMSSLQLVTHLPDSTKGRAKGHVLVRGMDKRGRVVEWVEKVSFDRFEQVIRVYFRARLSSNGSFPGQEGKEEEEEDEEDTFAGLQVTDKPEEMRSPSELRERLMQRHGKRLHVPIDLRPPPAKKVCLDRGGKALAPEVLAPAASRPNGDGASASARFLRMPQGLAQRLWFMPMVRGVTPLLWWGPLCQRGLWRHRTGVPCFTGAEARHPLGISESAVPPVQHLQEWTMPEAVEVVTSGICYMMRSREQLFERLKVVEAMHAFISQHLGGVDELRAQLEKVEAELAFAWKAELEEEYQQQADEMYFFGYRCCMKKNGIMHDTPSFPSDEDDEAPGGPSS